MLLDVTPLNVGILRQSSTHLLRGEAPQRTDDRRVRKAESAIARSAPIKPITNNTGKVGTGTGLIVIGAVPVLLPGFESPPPDTVHSVHDRAQCIGGDSRRHRNVGVTRRRGERIRACTRPRGDGASPARARERGDGQARRRCLRHGDGTACRRGADVRHPDRKGDGLPRQEDAASCTRLRQREVASSYRGNNFDRSCTRAVAGICIPTACHHRSVHDRARRGRLQQLPSP